MEENKFSGFRSYEDLVESLGYSTVVWKNENNYQGDTIAIVKDSIGRYGVLIFGWGSCSGCDALQACETLADFLELGDRLRGSIQWHDSAEAVAEWIATKDWEASFLESDLVERFIAAANVSLERIQ